MKSQKLPRTMCAALALFMCAQLSACGKSSIMPVSPSVTSPSSENYDQSQPVDGASPETDPIQTQLDAMSTRQKVGQLFIIRPDSLDLTLSQNDINDAEVGVTSLTNEMQQTLEDYPVGGIAMFNKNIAGEAQLKSFISDLQNASDIPLFMAVDEEGGLVARLANSDLFSLPKYESAAAIASMGTDAVLQMSQTIGNYIKQFGFNLDFAPDADVNTNLSNPVIGTRSFSSDPQTAAQMVNAAVNGFHSAGVMCSLKHFPGHGDTATDTHYGCATTDKTWQQMLECEIIPFTAGISAGADMVMVSHITSPNATNDGLPASLSKEMITDKLRAELRYNGIVITDSLAMEAITDFFTADESAVMSFNAGADILLMPNGLEKAFDAVLAAVENGDISQDRLDESVYRILSLKADMLK